MPFLIVQSGWVMTNKYSFQDTGSKHIVYQEQMEQFDLSFRALQEFAFAVRDNELSTLQSMFGILTPQQREGLLTIELDYSVLADPFDWAIPSQIAVRHAQNFKHNNVAQFLIDAKFDLTISQIKSASASTPFKSSFVLFPPDITFHADDQGETGLNMKQGM